MFPWKKIIYMCFFNFNEFFWMISFPYPLKKICFWMTQPNPKQKHMHVSMYIHEQIKREPLQKRKWLGNVNAIFHTLKKTKHKLVHPPSHFQFFCTAGLVPVQQHHILKNSLYCKGSSTKLEVFLKIQWQKLPVKKMQDLSSKGSSNC